jgi:cytoskeletal protein CcmA (bactofilin family)
VEQATSAAQEAVRAAGEAMRAVEVGGMGVRLSDEAIRIAGSGIVSGQPVRTREFKAAGSAKVQGGLEAEVAKVAGSCAFEGDVRVEDFRSSGSTRIAGGLHAETVEASGSLVVEKDVEAEDLVTSGTLRVGGNVKAEQFHAAGSVQVDGQIVAEDVRIELGGSSAVQGIRAEEIHVGSTGGFLRPRGDLRAGRIEGERVLLEATTADYVSGKEVRIGPHCHIAKVAAKDLVVHESSDVKERVAQGG